MIGVSSGVLCCFYFGVWYFGVSIFNIEVFQNEYVFGLWYVRGVGGWGRFQESEIKFFVKRYIGDLIIYFKIKEI